MTMNGSTSRADPRHGIDKSSPPVLVQTIYDDNEKESKTPSQFEKIFAALFYGFSSLGVILVNKIVMTMYKFPHFDVLATAQFLATSLIITILIGLRKVEVSKLSLDVVLEVFPITAMFLANVISGLGGTGQLNLPMFTALRRTSILMALVGQYFILNKSTDKVELFSIFLMVGGAFIAAFYDLTYDPSGYFYVTLNNIFTALSGIYMKKASIGGKCNKNGILYYNSLFSLVAMLCYFIVEHMYRHSANIVVPLGAIAIDSAGTKVTPATEVSLSIVDHLWAFDGWFKPDFVVTFIMAAMMGSVLNYATFLCTTTNSALTTAVVGTVKNIVATYIGMFMLSDYVFNWINFIGLNISIFGSIIYTYVTFFKQQ